LLPVASVFANRDRPKLAQQEQILELDLSIKLKLPELLALLLEDS
jgi:hypothetical protein